MWWRTDAEFDIIFGCCFYILHQSFVTLKIIHTRSFGVFSIKAGDWWSRDVTEGRTRHATWQTKFNSIMKEIKNVIHDTPVKERETPVGESTSTSTATQERGRRVCYRRVHCDISVGPSSCLVYKFASLWSLGNIYSDQRTHCNWVQPIYLQHCPVVDLRKAEGQTEVVMTCHTREWRTK